MKTVAVQSYAAVYRQFCVVHYSIPRFKHTCRHLGITNNTLALSSYYKSESDSRLIKFNADYNIKTKRPVLCELAVIEESDFVSKIVNCLEKL